MDIYINEKNKISYSSSNNKYRKSESDYINECFDKFGPNETINERKTLNSVLKKSFSLDENYKNELAFLELSYQNNLLSEPFYKYYKNVYWSLSILSKLEKSIIDVKLLDEIKKSFSNSEYLLKIYEYRRLVTFYNDFLLKKKSITNQEIDNQNIIDYLLYSEIKNTFNQYSKEKATEQQIDLFRQKCKNLNFIKEIEENLLIENNQLTVSEILSQHK